MLRTPQYQLYPVSATIPASFCIRAGVTQMLPLFLVIRFPDLLVEGKTDG